MAFAWSTSALEMFESCAKKYFHLKVAKDFKDEDTTWSAEGKEIHDALFKRVVLDKPLPLQLRPLEPMAKRFADARGQKFGEMKLALNAEFKPREFFAKDVWVRSIVDLLIIQDGTHAIIVDWKTGKNRKDDYDQIKLSAAVLSQWMPELDKFTLLYVWTKLSEISPPKVLEKDHLPTVWAEQMPRAQRIQDALKTTSFPASESGLCKFCPVTTCPYNKR